MKEEVLSTPPQRKVADLTKHLKKIRDEGKHFSKYVNKMVNKFQAVADIGKVTYVNFEINKLTKLYEGKDGLGNPEDITVLDTHTVLVADPSLEYVPAFTVYGMQDQKYYPVQREGAICGVDVCDNHVFILQERVITRENIGDGTKKSFKPNITDMYKMLVVDLATLILSDLFAGKVYMYMPNKDITSVLLGGLRGPTYMSMAHTEQGLRYAVTESRNHRVNIYDETWKLLTSVGGGGSLDGQLYYPWGILLTQNYLLVTDSENKRVCEFHLDGRFRRHLLTHHDGLVSPIALTYSHQCQRLWVVQWRSNDWKLRCYEVE